MKKQKGITLISLIVTIVVLSITIAVVLNLIAGSNGIISKSARGTYSGDDATNDTNRTITGLYINNPSTSDKSVGLFGLVGSSGTVKNITVSGQLLQNNSDRVAGGICGYAVSTTTKIDQCYNYNGNVEAYMNCVGGIIGRNDGIIISNCYNIGENISSASGNGYYGSIIGNNAYASTSIAGCYYLNTSSLNAIGGGTTSSNIVTKTDAQFKAAASNTSSVTYLLNGNSATGVWAVDTTGAINGGYPYLKNISQ